MGQPSCIVERLSGEVDLFQLHCLNPERYPFLLQSSAPNDSTGRFDILFAFPQERLELKNSELTFSQQQTTLSDKTFLQAFDDVWKELSTEGEKKSVLPFRGGWFMYLGYELVHEIEPTLMPLERRYPTLPDACAVRIPAAIIFDHQTRQYTAIVEDNFRACLSELREDWNILSSAVSRGVDLSVASSIFLDEEEPESYLQGVERIKEYIKDGDVFQVNLSRLWRYRCDEGSYQHFYRLMRSVNPAPFSGMAKIGESVIASMSPERLIKITSEKIAETRPIAGTRPRGQNKSADEILAKELLQHTKEQAEHIMLVDLERNDLGRVCIPGSIDVSEMMGLESYATVHHIVSNIRGKLRADVTPGQVIAAVFPGGTITGCPKVRCMEIISELEQEARQAYTGSMGYINHDGSMDLNILIRTMVFHQGEVSFRAGAGIVHDSEPFSELEETRAKARGMLNVIEGL